MGIEYDIIFTDFSMPVMNGIESTRKIRKHYADRRKENQPIIIGITGHTLEKYKDEGA